MESNQFLRVTPRSSSSISLRSCSADLLELSAGGWGAGFGAASSRFGLGAVGRVGFFGSGRGAVSVGLVGAPEAEDPAGVAPVSGASAGGEPGAASPPPFTGSSETGAGVATGGAATGGEAMGAPLAAGASVGPVPFAFVKLQ